MLAADEVLETVAIMPRWQSETTADWSIATGVYENRYLMDPRERPPFRQTCSCVPALLRADVGRQVDINGDVVLVDGVERKVQWHCTGIAEPGEAKHQNCSGKIKHVVPRVKGKVTVALELRDSAEHWTCMFRSLTCIIHRVHKHVHRLAASDASSRRLLLFDLGHLLLGLVGALLRLLLEHHAS